MTGVEISAIITSIASLVAAVGSTFAVVVTLVNGRKIEQVHQSTNGMKEELVQATRDGAFAAGLKEGQSAVVVKVDAVAVPPPKVIASVKKSRARKKRKS